MGLGVFLFLFILQVGEILEGVDFECEKVENQVRDCDGMLSGVWFRW